MSGFVAKRLLEVRSGRIKPFGWTISHREETTSSTGSLSPTCGRETWKPNCCCLTEEQAGRRMSILELQFMVYNPCQIPCFVSHSPETSLCIAGAASKRITSQIGCPFYRQLLCGTLTVDHVAQSYSPGTVSS